MAKRIIKKKIYDTDSASYIGEWENTYCDSPYKITEALYKKTNGEYFLHIKGGAGTKYAIDVSNYDCIGKGAGWIIQPLKENEVIEWLDEKSATGRSFYFNLDENEERYSIEKLFPDITE